MVVVIYAARGLAVGWQSRIGTHMTPIPAAAVPSNAHEPPYSASFHTTGALAPRRTLNKADEGSVTTSAGDFSQDGLLEKSTHQGHARPGRRPDAKDRMCLTLCGRN